MDSFGKVASQRIEKAKQVDPTEEDERDLPDENFKSKGGGENRKKLSAGAVLPRVLTLPLLPSRAQSSQRSK